MPVDGSKLMPDISPVVERMTVPPVPDGSLPVTVKWMFLPTVTFWGPGTLNAGRTLAETTVTMT